MVMTKNEMVMTKNKTRSKEKYVLMYKIEMAMTNNQNGNDKNCNSNNKNWNDRNNKMNMTEMTIFHESRPLTWMFQVTVGHSLEMTMEQMTVAKWQWENQTAVKLYRYINYSNKRETDINIASYYKAEFKQVIIKMTVRKWQ